jgi:hypothetical protein
MEFRSIFGSQSMAISPPLWVTSFEATENLAAYSGAWESLLLQLRGKENQLAMYNIGRSRPVGNMRGVMTFATACVQGTSTFTINSPGQAGKTLVAGDYIGFGNGLTQQVVLITANATSNASGNIVVTVEPPLNNAFAIGSAITWDHPCALFRRTGSDSSWEYSNIVINGMNISLVEDVRP